MPQQQQPLPAAGAAAGAAEGPSEMMRRVETLGVWISWCTWSIALLVIIGAWLPPGMLEPGTNRVRFVSDGFRDHRGIPLACFAFLLVMVLFFWTFTYLACMHTPDKNNTFSTHYIVGLCGLASVAGFATLTLFSSGSIHLLGASIFMLGYILMQFTIDNMMGDLMDQPFWSKVQQAGIFSMATLGVFLFGGLLTYSYFIGGGDPRLLSGSAIAEYAVFVSFLALNLWGCNIISSVAQKYWDGGDQNAKGLRKWIPLSPSAMYPFPEPYGSWMSGMIKYEIIRTASSSPCHFQGQKIHTF